MEYTEGYKAVVECLDDPRQPMYVRKQMKIFKDICEDKHPEFTMNYETLERAYSILKVFNMPDADESNLTYGKSVYECYMDYEFVLFETIHGVVYRENPKLMAYREILLEVARKNFKTFWAASEYGVRFFISPRNTVMYVVAEDKDKAKLIKTFLEGIIDATPAIKYLPEFKTVQKKKIQKERFKINKDEIIYPKYKIKCQFLAYNNQSAVNHKGKDGYVPRCYIADEAGTYPNSYVIDALTTGQVNEPNALGIILSSKYAKLNNPFEKRVKLAKDVLDGKIPNTGTFALLYEPDKQDDEDAWRYDDLVLHHANPALKHNPWLLKSRQNLRQKALNDPDYEGEFLTKVCNIICTDIQTQYVPTNLIKKNMVNHIDWTSREVYIGLDLSTTDDNTALAIVDADVSERIIADVYAFVPSGKIKTKEHREHVNYTQLIKTGKVLACGEKVIDYGNIIDFIIKWERENKAIIKGVSIDPFNADDVINELDIFGYDVTLTTQHSRILHAPTKFLRECILTNRFTCENNELLLINFQNAICTKDTNLNSYVNKRLSSGKVDMVAALINAVYLARKEDLNPTQDIFVNTFIAE